MRHIENKNTFYLTQAMQKKKIHSTHACVVCVNQSLNSKKIYKFRGKYHYNKGFDKQIKSKVKPYHTRA